MAAPKKPIPPKSPVYPRTSIFGLIEIHDGDDLSDILSKIPPTVSTSDISVRIEVEESGGSCCCCCSTASVMVDLRYNIPLPKEDVDRLIEEFNIANKEYGKAYKKFQKEEKEYLRYIYEKRREAAALRAAKAKERRSNKGLLENSADPVGKHK